MNSKANFISTLFILLCLFTKSYSQAPLLLNYQGVARNGTEILANKTIGFQFTIHDLSTGGVAVYSETQSVQTNAYGIFTAKIGNGTVVAGAMNSIDWSLNNKYLEVDMDTTNTGNFQTLSTNQLLSVPYALYANKADTAGYVINTPTLSVSVTGDSLSISNGNAVSMAMLVPPGTIQAYAGASAPAGWLLCDGSSYPNTQYPTLYNVISTYYGGSGTHFNVPDLRGMFLRGVNGTAANNLGVVANNDPDAATRTAMNPGGNTGDNIGSVEEDTFANHNHSQNAHSHSISDPGHSHGINNSNTPGGSNDCYEGGGGFVGVQSSTQSATTGISIVSTTATNNPTGGSETRPKNVYVNYIIKY